MRIGIDIEGSDASPSVLWEGVLEARKELPEEVEFLVFANPSFCQIIQSEDSITLVPSQGIISMEDNPLHAVRRKKEATLVKAMQMHAKGELQAVVSCGNTGALYIAGYLFLPRLNTIERPALLATIPSSKGYVTVLDVGGNVDCHEGHLIQFADLGAAYCKAVRSIEKPRIALLNVGQETTKGSALHRSAFQLLSEPNARYQFKGNIEGRDIFHSDVDVVVCDGFSGNVLLKTAEGVGLFLIEKIQKVLGDQLSADKLAYFQSLFNYVEHPGGLLVGVRGHVIKCHGAATPQALAKSILFAAELAAKDISNKIALHF